MCGATGRQQPCRVRSPRGRPASPRRQADGLAMSRRRRDLRRFNPLVNRPVRVSSRARNVLPVGSRGRGAVHHARRGHVFHVHHVRVAGVLASVSSHAGVDYHTNATGVCRGRVGRRDRVARRRDGGGPWSRASGAAGHELSGAGRPSRRGRCGRRGQRGREA